MSEPEAAPAPTLLDTLRKTLNEAPAPTSLKELTKGLTKPAKQKAAEFEAAIAELLTEDLGTGKVFKNPSGKEGVERYWSKDEKQMIRETVLAEAITLATVADLVKKATAVVAKADKGFVESIVRDLIGEEKLYQHPPKKAEGQPLFGVTAPPPPPPPLIDTLHKTLKEASAPLSLKELVKGLPRPAKQKPAEFEQALVGLLAQEVELGSLYKCASGAKGAERYWIRDEKSAIREATLSAAETPSAETVLSATAQKATGADKAFVESVLKELIEGKQLHKQSTAKKPLYGKEPLPERNVREPVIAALLNAAETPDTETKLVAVAQKATGADKAFVESILEELIEGKQLHKQSSKKLLYGKTEPPHPLEVDPGKKAFAALVKAAQKVLEAVSQVPLDEMFQRLRKALEQQQPERHEGLPSVPVPHPTPVSPDVPSSTPHSPPPTSPPKHEPLTSERIRTVLKAAYDELCLDVEFQDKVVEVRRLFHEAVRELPGLTPEQFHRELKHLQHSRTLELQALNEVQRAKEPELAIRDGDRLLYFAIWR